MQSITGILVLLLMPSFNRGAYTPHAAWRTILFRRDLFSAFFALRLVIYSRVVDTIRTALLKLGFVTKEMLKNLVPNRQGTVL